LTVGYNEACSRLTVRLDKAYGLLTSSLEMEGMVNN
jgi:hypothetical protein